MSRRDSLRQMLRSFDMARSAARDHFSLSGGWEFANTLPSPAGRGAGGEGPRPRNLPASGPIHVPPSPQTPLPVGEGFQSFQRDMVLAAAGRHIE